jgi:hypothetical protein
MSWAPGYHISGQCPSSHPARQFGSRVISERSSKRSMICAAARHKLNSTHKLDRCPRRTEPRRFRPARLRARLGKMNAAFARCTAPALQPWAVDRRSWWPPRLEPAPPRTASQWRVPVASTGPARPCGLGRIGGAEQALNYPVRGYPAKSPGPQPQRSGEGEGRLRESTTRVTRATRAFPSDAGRDLRRGKFRAWFE